MYAVVNTGGKQYKVREGEVHRFEKIPAEVGSRISFDRVLMVSDGENVQVGQPVVPDMAVQGHVVEQGKARKVLVFKYKRRKRYRRKLGHRQQFTAVRIDRIGGPDTGAEETPAVGAGAVETPVQEGPAPTQESEEGAPEAPTTTEE